MDNEVTKSRSDITGAVGFWFGGILGNFATFLIAISGFVGWILAFLPEEQALARLLSTIVLVFVTFGVGGAVTGVFNGLALNRIDAGGDRHQLMAGISMQQSQWGAAAGAFLLVLTNYLATLFAGGLIPVLVGLDKQGVRRKQARFRQIGFRVFGLGILLISAPLAYTAYSRLMSLVVDSKATLEVQSWLEGTSYVVESVEVTDHLVIAAVDRNGDLPPMPELTDQLAMVLNRLIIIDLGIIRALINNTSIP